MRPIHTIARDIIAAWPKPYFGAVPYLRAMRELSATSDTYGANTGDSVVRYFLSNAAYWRGPVARTLKAELKEHLK